MLKSVTIKNYKSIKELSLEFGRVNVFIGENGCGKSNLLEALVMAAASESNKLDNEFLASRGVRVTEASLMCACFDEEAQPPTIEININYLDNYATSYIIRNDNQSYPKWFCSPQEDNPALDTIANLTEGNPELSKKLDVLIREHKKNIADSVMHDLIKILGEENSLVKNIKEDSALADVFNMLVEERLTKFFHKKIYKNLASGESTKIPVLSKFDQKITDIKDKFKSFLIFSPENSALRNFYKEGQIEPLGINGEGLLKLLKVIEATDKDGLAVINQMLNLFGWYEAITIPSNLSYENDKILIKDKFLKTKKFDQRSANEGFLFVLFYTALIVSKDTPKIFAIDNIDASLNPRLCTKLIEEMAKLAKRYDKQIFLTTHNPATLDGLDLNDDEQRLFVISRSRNGDTRSKQVPKDKYNKEEIRLSEAMLNGYLGGLPKGF